jgi:ubiquinone/menaquinone biosynthesis C-methylase UbiE
LDRILRKKARMTAYDGAVEARVAQHYATQNLEQRILGAFEAAGKPRASITADDLAAVDEFHIGGREATEAIAAQMNLRPGMRLLDIGCGIGGPARYFASAQGCHVTGIDLTPEYVRTAQALSALVGLSASVQFEQGSAAALSFEGHTFDGAYMFHVGMNIQDKVKLFREVKRVLRDTAVFAIFDVMRIGPGELQFPVPWASKADESFVATTDDYRKNLIDQGFAITAQSERKQFALDFFARMRQRNEQQGPRPLGLHLVMGETATLKLSNVVDGLRRGVIAPVELVARA